MMQQYRFHPRAGFTLLWTFFFVLFCALGVWQLHRYQFKKNLLHTFQVRLNAAPIEFNQALKAKDLNFLPIKAEGSYLNSETMFVQGQFNNDRMGFDVITPFKMANDATLLLVDRGWVQQTNPLPPRIADALGSKVIAGHVKLLNEYQFILGDNILQPTQKPLIMQKINIKELEHLTQQHYYPFVLRLDANEADGFVRDWSVTTITPERHMGYAIQWFVMAFVVMIAYFCFCFERIEKRGVPNAK